MTNEERWLLIRVERRAEQVRKLAALACQRDQTYVPSIMAYVAWNLIRTLLLLLWEPLSNYIHLWLRSLLRREAGLCDLCGQPLDHSTDIACAACLKDLDDDDREAEIQVLMDKAPTGSAH